MINPVASAAIKSILVTLCFFVAPIGVNAAPAQFDGSKQLLKFPKGEKLLSNELDEIVIGLNPSGVVEDETSILTITTGDVLAFLTYGDSGRSVVFTDTAGEEQRVLDFKLLAGQAYILHLRRKQNKWQVVLHDLVYAEIAEENFIPNTESPISLNFGDERFKGYIDVEVRNAENQIVLHTNAKGRLIKRIAPSLGSYTEQDTGHTRPIPSNLEGIDAAHHGVFDKQTFYAISATTDGIAVSVDWGGYVEFVPHPEHADRYVTKYQDQGWAGYIEFDESSSAGIPPSFKVYEHKSAGTRKFLKNNARYSLSPVRSKGEGEQILGSVWADSNFPPNFNFSIMSCFNAIEMSLRDLQESGCGGNALFALPPAKEGGYSNIAAPHILPFGWGWYTDSVTDRTVFSTLATSSDDYSSAFSGSSQSGFNILGYHNESNGESYSEIRNLAAKEKMLSIQQYFQREYSVVVQPDTVYLDPCFIRRVIRAASSLRKKNYGLSVAPRNREVEGPSYYNPEKSYRECPERIEDDYPIERFVKDYGTHFANAITYGARAVRTGEVSRTEALKMAANRHNLNKSQGYEFQATIGNKKASYPVKGGYGSGRGSGSGQTTETGSSYKLDNVKVVCFGGVSCTESGDAQASNNPIPIYLDLVRLDALLAPPYFNDAAIVIDLRKALAEHLDQLLLNKRGYFPPAVRLIDFHVQKKECEYLDPPPKKIESPKDLRTIYICNEFGKLAMSIYSTIGKNREFLLLSQSKSLDTSNARKQILLDTGNFFTDCQTNNAQSTCTDGPKFSLVLEPRISHTLSLSQNKHTSFQLFQHVGGPAIDDILSRCSTSQCRQRIRFNVSGYYNQTNYFLGGTVATLPIHIDVFSLHSQTIVDEAATFVYRRTDATDVDLVKMKLTLKVSPRDLPGMLGFAAGIPDTTTKSTENIKAVAPDDYGVNPNWEQRHIQNKTDPNLTFSANYRKQVFSALGCDPELSEKNALLNTKTERAKQIVAYDGLPGFMIGGGSPKTLMLTKAWPHPCKGNPGGSWPVYLSENFAAGIDKTSFKAKPGLRKKRLSKSDMQAIVAPSQYRLQDFGTGGCGAVTESEHRKGLTLEQMIKIAEDANADGFMFNPYGVSRGVLLTKPYNRDCQGNASWPLFLRVQ